MPDHVPVAAPRRALTRDHAWDRLWWWHALYAAVFAGTAALVAVGSVPAGRKAACLALMAVLVCWFGLVGLPAFRGDDERRGVAYVAGVVVLFCAAYALVPNASILLFILCPHCFMTVRLRRALWAVATLIFVPAVVTMYQAGWRLPVVGGALAAAAIVFGFSAGFGTWIGRIIGQSHERAELIEELDATRAELAEVSHAAGAFAERERLASDIHDTLAQGFTSILMLLQAASSAIDREPSKTRRHLALAERTARENLAEARALVAALAPAQLGSEPLPEALRRIVDRVGDELGIDAHFELTGTPRPLSPAAEVVLLRATQEALANVRKHARARTVEARLAYHHDGCVLMVADDGRGFDPARVDGYGLRGLRSRVEQVGGSVEVTSAPGEGSRVRVSLP